MKRIIVIVSVVLIVVGAVCLSGCGTRGTSSELGYSDGLKYSKNNTGNTCTVTSIGDCKDTEIIIPQRNPANDRDITAISAKAFTNCVDVKSIYVSDGVKLIGKTAFGNCASLSSLSLPASVEQIDNRTFYNCDKLTTITFRGTKEQWRKIKLANNVFVASAVETIHCTDGDISLSEESIYSIQRAESGIKISAESVS